MKKNPKLLQHMVFVVGHSSSCERRRTGLNFVERTRRDAVHSDSQLKNGSSINSDHFDATDLRPKKKLKPTGIMKK